MKGLSQNLAVVAVVAVTSIGATACGSSSSSKTTAKTPPTPSTPSTTTTAAATGPLTKAKFEELAGAFHTNPAVVKHTAAVKSGNIQAEGAAAPAFVSALRNFASQVEALKAPSAAAATAQQKFVSVVKEYAAATEQFSKAISANDKSAAQALEPKLTKLEQQYAAAINELTSALQ